MIAATARSASAGRSTPKRPQAVGAFRRQSPEREAEHPDTDDGYTRQLPDPVVRGGHEECDAARSGRGDLTALQQKRRPDRTHGRDDNRAADEQQADDPQLAERLEVERVRKLAR